jgi:hypothetical protein
MTLMTADEIRAAFVVLTERVNAPPHTVAYDAPDDVLDMADALAGALERRPVGDLYSPSRIARYAKVDYGEKSGLVLDALHWMDRHRFVLADGNGAWRKYGRRV